MTIQIIDGVEYEVTAQMGCKCDGCLQEDCPTMECDTCMYAMNRVERRVDEEE